MASPVKHRSNAAYWVPIAAGVVGMLMGGPAMGAAGYIVLMAIAVPLAALAAFRDNAEEHLVNGKQELEMYKKLKRKGL